MNGTELLQEYSEGKRIFCGANLRGANLSGANLRYANLSGANLRYADLRDADLGYADLSGANLSGANLRGANLRGANLRDANLRGANLRYANLSGANLRYADLRDADLGYADLSGADLPCSSHDVIAEILRQAAKDSVSKRMIAGCVLVSRDWCWNDFAFIIKQSEGFQRDLWEWALLELRQWVCFRSHVEALALSVGMTLPPVEKEEA